MALDLALISGALMEGKDKEKRETSIIRMSGRDINGSYNVVRALMQIKGIGYNMARAIATSCSRLYGINESTQLGALNEQELAKLEEAIKDPKKLGIPTYLMNRRNDFESGMDIHLVGTDLTVRNKRDIDTGIKIQTWIGSRHQYGQKVRGQRTRSTGRTGATIGVMKKAVQAQQKEAQQQKGAVSVTTEKK